MFVHNAQQHTVWQKPNTADWHKHLTATVKPGGKGLIVPALNCRLRAMNLSSKRIKMLDWPSQGSNVSLTERLCMNGCSQKSAPKFVFPPQQCETTKSCRKSLRQRNAAKGGSTITGCTENFSVGAHNV